MHTLPAFIALLATQDPQPKLRSRSSGGNHDVCHVCSCDSCDDERYTMGNIGGTWTLPEYLQKESGVESVPCASIHTQDIGGFISPEVCIDDTFRLLPSFRDACGCPSLLAQSDPPSAAPTSAPADTCEQDRLFCLLQAMEKKVGIFLGLGRK